LIQNSFNDRFQV